MQLTSFSDKTKAKGLRAFRCKNCSKDLLKFTNKICKSYDITKTL